MHILILQHARVETAGSLGQFLKEDGHTSEVVHLDEGEKLPENSNFDGLWVLGGPMDVWEEEKYPWLKEEKAFIKYQVKFPGSTDKDPVVSSFTTSGNTSCISCAITPSCTPSF